MYITDFTFSLAFNGTIPFITPSLVFSVAGLHDMCGFMLGLSPCIVHFPLRVGIHMMLATLTALSQKTLVHHCGGPPSLTSVRGRVRLVNLLCHTGGVWSLFLHLVSGLPAVLTGITPALQSTNTWLVGPLLLKVQFSSPIFGRAHYAVLMWV